MCSTHIAVLCWCQLCTQSVQHTEERAFREGGCAVQHTPEAAGAAAHYGVCCGVLCYCTAGMAGVSQQHTGMFPALLLLVDQISEPGVGVGISVAGFRPSTIVPLNPCKSPGCACRVVQPYIAYRHACWFVPAMTRRAASHTYTCSPRAVVVAVCFVLCCYIESAAFGL